MNDLATLFVLAAAVTTAVAIAAAAALKAWRDWLDLKRRQIGTPHGARAPAPQRIELADLKERVRRLEAIADGAED